MRSVAFHTQVESLEGRALMTASPGVLTVASYWVGWWEVNNNALLDVSEAPPHDSPYPYLDVIYTTNFFSGSISSAQTYYFVLPLTLNPDASTLTGSVDTLSSGTMSLGTFTLNATPNPDYMNVNDTFTGQFTTSAGTVDLEGTYLGENYEPGLTETGWGLPRERPIPEPTAPPPARPVPPLNKEVHLKVSIHPLPNETPRKLSVNQLDQPIEVTWVETVKNDGPGDLPAERAYAAVGKEGGYNYLLNVQVVSIPTGATITPNAENEFLTVALPPLRVGQTAKVVVAAWTEFSSNLSRDKYYFSVHADAGDLGLGLPGPRVDGGYSSYKLEFFVPPIMTRR